MQTTSTSPAAGSVDPRELDRHIAEMYRDVANEAGRELHFPHRPATRRSARLPRELHKYGAQSVSLLAVKPVRASRHSSRPDLGGGADVAQAARNESSINTTKTEEVTK